MATYPSTTAASDVWSLRDVYKARAGNDWPSVTVPGLNISGATFLQSFAVSDFETIPAGLFFKPDGTKMYISGNSGDGVDEFSLSTAWDISTASSSSYFDAGSQDNTVADLFFKPDGTKMYICGNGNDSIFQYSLSTAWSSSTASYDSKSYSVASQDASPLGLFFKSDGTKMYIAGRDNDSIFQYSLSTAWDVSTASYDSVSLDISAQTGSPEGLFFSADGTKMLVIEDTNDSVLQYTLSTAWDLSTASYDNVSFSVGTQESVPRGVFVDPTESKMYITGSISDSVHQYTL